MSEDKQQQSIKLPERLVSSVDLARITRELRSLDDWLTQAGLRSGGEKVTSPKTSATLEELAMVNGVSLLEKNHREQLLNVLSAFMEHAPRIHMSFAVEPSAVFLNRMIVWLRSSIHPLILLEVGLQPTIVAGCTVRTTNKVFDMSLRHRFTDSRPLLVQSIAKFENLPLNPTVQATTAEPVQPVQQTLGGQPVSSASVSATVAPKVPEAQSPSPESPKPPAEAKATSETGGVAQ